MPHRRLLPLLLALLLRPLTADERTQWLCGCIEYSRVLTRVLTCGSGRVRSFGGNADQWTDGGCAPEGPTLPSGYSSPSCARVRLYKVQHCRTALCCTVQCCTHCCSWLDHSGYRLCGATERTALLFVELSDGLSGTASASSHSFDVMLDCTGAPTLLEINCNPSLSLESVYPIDGAQVL